MVLYMKIVSKLFETRNQVTISLEHWFKIGSWLRFEVFGYQQSYGLRVRPYNSRLMLTCCYDDELKSCYLLLYGLDKKGSQSIIKYQRKDKKHAHMVVPLDAYFDPAENQIRIRFFNKVEGIQDLLVTLPQNGEPEAEASILEPELIPVFNFTNQLIYSSISPVFPRESLGLATIFETEIREETQNRVTKMLIDCETKSFSEPLILPYSEYCSPDKFDREHYLHFQRFYNDFKSLKPHEMDQLVFLDDQTDSARDNSQSPRYVLLVDYHDGKMEIISQIRIF